jgi:hypothetical protein
MHFSNLLSTVVTTALVLYPSAISAYTIMLSDHTDCSSGTQLYKTGQTLESFSCLRLGHGNFDAKAIYLDGVYGECNVWVHTDLDQGCANAASQRSTRVLGGSTMCLP